MPSINSKTRSEMLSKFARRMREERTAHEMRISHMNRRITEYHNRVRQLLRIIACLHTLTVRISAGRATPER